jgi:predicted  nucleic acid-binding Zn-ribbon protein
MSSEDIEELKFQLDYYKQKASDLTARISDAVRDKAEQEEYTANLLNQNTLDLFEKHEQAMEVQVKKQHKLYDQYAQVRNDITALIDQFDWEDSHGRAYNIKCRHPDLKDNLQAKLNSVRKHHWHYDPKKHQDGFL